MHGKVGEEIQESESWYHNEKRINSSQIKPSDAIALKDSLICSSTTFTFIRRLPYACRRYHLTLPASQGVIGLITECAYWLSHA